MQNRYVGDVGDFGKFGLLRALCQPEGAGSPALRLGVNWYLTPDETHNNDGRHVGYLEPTPRNLEAFRVCDPGLYDALGDIVKRDARHVSVIRQRRVLPEATVYYERLLDLSSTKVRPVLISRSQARQLWVRDALHDTQDCDVVFVDPDNGIGTTSQASSRLGAKYVLLEELLPYFNRGQTLVIYHHLNRSATADKQVRLLGTILGNLFDRYGHCSAVRFRRGSARVFFVIPQEEHEDILKWRIARMLATSWGDHFLPYSL